MTDFLVYALLAGLGVAMVMGPLGVFVVWRRMAYFGDALAHSALLGIALGFALGISPTAGVIAACVAMAVLLVLLRQGRQLADDTVLGILSHSALAFGLIAVSFLETLRVDLISYLFGDLLAVSGSDLIWTYAGGTVVLCAVFVFWRPLVALTVHEELARVEGVDTARTQVVFTLLMACAVGLAMKVIGILLVTSLLIIPAATARQFARSPEQMAAFAATAGCLSVLLGLGGSLAWDLPSGPAIVAGAVVLFAVSALLPRTFSR